MQFKIKHLVVCLLCFVVTSFVFGNNNLQLTAEKAYAQKQYQEAIKCYETILHQGLVSYKLYYNLGNCYYKSNQIGRAIYYFECANKLQPNNADVKKNIAIANEKTIDKIESKENYFAGIIKTGIVTILSTNGWAWLSIGSLSLVFIFAFLYVVSKQNTVKRIGFFSSAFFFILFISSMIFGYSALNQKNSINFAVVLVRESKIKEEPNATSNSKFSLHEGTKVRVLDTNTEWTNIKLENGNEGWLRTAEVGLF
jgi:hypothetical protein